MQGLVHQVGTLLVEPLDLIAVHVGNRAAPRPVFVIDAGLGAVTDAPNT